MDNKNSVEHNKFHTQFRNVNLASYFSTVRCLCQYVPDRSPLIFSELSCRYRMQNRLMIEGFITHVCVATRMYFIFNHILCIYTASACHVVN